MIMRYTVVLEPQEEGGFTVQCVEIPGAISQGETREEALANIKEAIELVLEVQWKELHRQRSTVRHEISKVDVADVAKLPVVSGEEVVKYLARHGFVPQR